MIVRVNVVPNRTVVVDKDRRFDNLCGSHLQSQMGCIMSVYSIIKLILRNTFRTVPIDLQWLSKRQSLSATTVIFRTTFTRTIKLNLLK